MTVLIGPISCTTWLKKIILDHLRAIWTSQLGQNSSASLQASDYIQTSKFNLKINCYEHYSEYRSAENSSSDLELPAFYKEQQHGYSGGLFKKHANHHELGYLKKIFFDSLTVFKPAVSVLVFDWQTLQMGTFEWQRMQD